MGIAMSVRPSTSLRSSQTVTGPQTDKRGEASLRAFMFYGGCMLYSASRTQKIVSLSSAEADVYACSSGCSDAILLGRILSWLTGRQTTIYAYTDSSGAKGIPQRSGVGRLRHLSCRILWLQQLVSGGMVKLCSVSGSVNPADIGTKRLSAPRLRSLMAVLGLYNRTTGSLEGSDDPGKVFIKKHNVRALLCALSLMNFQGCNSEASPADGSQSLIIFTAVLGLVMLIPMMLSCFGRAVTTKLMQMQVQVKQLQQ